MTLELQFRIKNNPYLTSYLSENSYWYKALNRNPDDVIRLEKEMKEAYHLTIQDKMNRLENKIDFINNIMNILS